MSASLAPPAEPSPASSPSAASPKRRAILDAAADLFCGQGYGAVSMDAIARAANVSKATLYAHFTGKDALFAEIVAARLAEVKRDSLMRDSQGRPPRQLLQGMALHWLRFMLAPRTLAIYRIVIGEGARFPDLARAFHAAGPAQGRGWLAGWIGAEAAEGRLRPDTDPQRAAEQMFALLRGDLYLRCVLGLASEPDAAEVGAAVEAAVETFLRAYGPLAPDPA